MLFPVLISVDFFLEWDDEEIDDDDDYVAADDVWI